MIVLNSLLCGLLGFTLLWVAWQTVISTNLFQAVLLFLLFGLLMVITWAWLRAPEVALAEAILGSALTSVLFLEAVREWDDGQM